MKRSGLPSFIASRHHPCHCHVMNANASGRRLLQLLTRKLAFLQPFSLHKPHYRPQASFLTLKYCGYRVQQLGSRVLPRRPKRKEMPDSTQLPQPSPSSLNRMACSFCRRRKLKCDRRSPCESCQKFGFECEYAPGISSGNGRPDLKSSRVRQLEDRLGQS
jgi:hypothetical protein